MRVQSATLQSIILLFTRHSRHDPRERFGTIIDKYVTEIYKSTCNVLIIAIRNKRMRTPCVNRGKHSK